MMEDAQATDHSAGEHDAPGGRGRVEEVLDEAAEELAEFAAEAREELTELGEKVEAGIRTLRNRVADFLDRDAGEVPPEGE
ncbi:MAG: hypothetical protein AB7N73_08625 [Gemmatimonadales bacterium]